MAPPTFACYFTCLLMANVALTATSKSSFLHFQTVRVGDNVTLPCACQDEAAVMFYWYKQTLGHTPQLISTFYKHNDLVTFHDQFKDNQRFSLDTKRNYQLMILDFGISDSATYFCIGSDLYNFEFCQSTTVSANALDLQTIVHQSVSETTNQPGENMTLTCSVYTGTCDEEHSVYWFRNSEESHPGLIYTHGGRNDQCVRSHTPQTHSCVYNLPMTNLNRPHAGTYYCAVASCGHILFGNGTKLDLKDDADIMKEYLNIGFLVLNTILVVILTVLVFVIIKTKCDQCSEAGAEPSAPTTTTAESFQDEDNMQHAAVGQNKVNGSETKRDGTWSECVYLYTKQ